MLILYTGVFSDVLDYVLRISKNTVALQHLMNGNSEEDEVKVKPESVTARRKRSLALLEDPESNNIGIVCVECFKFLKALAKDHVEVQER